MFQHLKFTLHLMDKGLHVVSRGRGRGLWGPEAFVASLATWRTEGRGHLEPGLVTGNRVYDLCLTHRDLPTVVCSWELGHYLYLFICYFDL